MIPENINTLPLAVLSDLLSKTTMELLDVMNQKEAYDIVIRELRIELQLIQDAIEKSKSNKLRIVL